MPGRHVVSQKADAAVPRRYSRRAEWMNSTAGCATTARKEFLYVLTGVILFTKQSSYETRRNAPWRQRLLRRDDGPNVVSTSDEDATILCESHLSSLIWGLVFNPALNLTTASQRASFCPKKLVPEGRSAPRPPLRRASHAPPYCVDPIHPRLPDIVRPISIQRTMSGISSLRHAAECRSSRESARNGMDITPGRQHTSSATGWPALKSSALTGRRHRIDFIASRRRDSRP